jgi:hypothetical protein
MYESVFSRYRMQIMTLFEIASFCASGKSFAMTDKKIYLSILRTKILGTVNNRSETTLMIVFARSPSV